MEETAIKKLTEELLQEEVTKVINKYHKGDLREKAIKLLRQKERKNAPLKVKYQRIKNILFPTIIHYFACLSIICLSLICGVLVLIDFLVNKQSTGNFAFLDVPHTIAITILGTGFFFLAPLVPDDYRRIGQDDIPSPVLIHLLYIVVIGLMIAGCITSACLFTDLLLLDYLFRWAIFVIAALMIGIAVMIFNED